MYKFVHIVLYKIAQLCNFEFMYFAVFLTIYLF